MEPALGNKLKDFYIFSIRKSNFALICLFSVVNKVTFVLLLWEVLVFFFPLISLTCSYLVNDRFLTR